MFYDYFVSFIDAPDDMFSLVLIFSGCDRAMKNSPCEGCHNPELWDFKASLKSGKNIEDISDECVNNIEALVIMGGEPFDQNPKEIEDIVKKICSRNPALKIVIYTGYDSLDEISEKWKESGYNEQRTSNHPLLEIADFIKIGSYRKNIPPGKDSRLASGNQKMYKISNKNKSFLLKEVVF